MLAHDIYFGYTLAAQLVLVLVGYSIRLALRGAPHHERVGRIGGTALVSQGFMEGTYWALDPILRGLVAAGVTPNALTWSALVLGLAAGLAAAFGMIGLAALLAVWSTFGDILDGQVARLTNTGSDRGELFDAAVDRYTEFALFAGLVIFFRTSLPLMILTLAAMLASFMVSYASAKAEAMHVAVPRGLMRRHERATYVIAGLGFSSIVGGLLHAHVPVLPWYAFEIFGLAVVAVIGNGAAILRLVRIARALP